MLTHAMCLDTAAPRPLGMNGMKGLLRYGRSPRVPARKRRCIEGHEPNPIAASSCARTPLPRQLAVGECFECQFHCHAGLQSFDADAVYDRPEKIGRAHDSTPVT